MGMSIDAHVYDWLELKAEIARLVKENGGVPEGRDDVDTWCSKMLPRFGTVAGGKYITLWCEYYSDSGYNAGSELFRALELYYGLEDVFLSDYEISSGANAHDELEDEYGDDLELFEDGEDYY